MKTVDLFLYSATLVIVGASLPACVYADAPSPESFNKAPELVLTLSDQWQQMDRSNSPSRAFKPNYPHHTDGTPNENPAKGPINVDCGMNLSPYNTGTDSSFTGRLTGECDLHYHY